MDESRELVKRHLKVLLLHLAAKSEKPSVELQTLLHETIGELHAEVKAALRTRDHLRLVGTGDTQLS
jgi:hypothetical protein